MSSRTWTVSFTATAAEQAQVVNDWWLQERPSAPGLFSEELTRAVERLKSMPGSGAVFDSTSVPGAGAPSDRRWRLGVNVDLEPSP